MGALQAKVERLKALMQALQPTPQVVAWDLDGDDVMLTGCSNSQFQDSEGAFSPREDLSPELGSDGSGVTEYLFSYQRSSTQPCKSGHRTGGKPSSLGGKVHFRHCNCMLKQRKALGAQRNCLSATMERTRDEHCLNKSSPTVFLRHFNRFMPPQMLSVLLPGVWPHPGQP